MWQCLYMRSQFNRKSESSISGNYGRCAAASAAVAQSYKYTIYNWKLLPVNQNRKITLINMRLVNLLLFDIYVLKVRNLCEFACACGCLKWCCLCHWASKTLQKVTLVIVRARVLARDSFILQSCSCLLALPPLSAYVTIVLFLSFCNVFCCCVWYGMV